MRVLAVDPWTGEPATRGILRFFDLANHQTVLAIETADVGTVQADGRVVLEGPAFRIPTLPTKAQFGRELRCPVWG